jgi:F0F1-type ATP synthase assembly protein I
MRGAGLVGVGVVLGWLASKTWSDPGCQLGLVVFLVVTAVMTLGFLLAVVGHRREQPGAGDPDEDDESDHR